MKTSATLFASSFMFRYARAFHLAPVITNPRFSRQWCGGNPEIPVFGLRMVSSSNQPDFKSGDAIQVEVRSFGPLGASVDIIGIGHSPDDVLDETAPALGRGLIYQKEIRYFRERRNNVDVVKGEVLPAFVEKIRDDGKVDISLRVVGGRAKAEELAEIIMERLQLGLGGTIPVGDKSPPEQIAQEFPGAVSLRHHVCIALRNH